MNVEVWRNWVDEIEATSLSALLDKTSPDVRVALKRSLAREELTPEEGHTLYTATGDDLRAVVKCADLARAEDVGNEVTYVVNRNINFTNICFVGCQFCGFKRQRWESDAYDHPDEVVLNKVGEAIARGATEVCMQGGINPEMPDFKYRDVLTAIKTKYPEIHVHAFSPMEILFGAKRVRMDYPEYIGMLRDAGLGSIPGTAAEILDDSIREILSHKKVDVAAWVEIITTAHSLGVPTTSTIMYGHLENSRHVVNHLNLLRSIQKNTHGFTEFVPLRFIAENTVLYRKGLVKPPELGVLDFQMYAFARLFLRGQINNLQTSWVKLGVEVAALTLKAGCNDFSGTLMEESITREAGGDSGEFVPVDLIEEKARQMGRVAVERSTLYKKLYGRKAPNGARPIVPSQVETGIGAGGGVGAAKFIRGLVRVIPPERLTVVVNTGDDETFFGLHVSPDVDTVMYTLAGEVHPGQGWGLRDESFRVLEALTRFYGKPWFGLGDRDLATHLYRTDRLRTGAKLSDITADIAKRFGVKSCILPMSDDRVRTFVKLRGKASMPFQEYFVKGRARGFVEKIELRGLEDAHPLPSVLDAIRNSATIVLAPSNPFVSLGPIFGLRGVRDALVAARDRVVAISPIVGGKTIKGPADKMLRGLGMEVSALGIARLYKEIVGTFVLDKVDAAYIEPIRNLGMRAVVADTIMTTPAKSARLARVIMRTIMKDSSRLSDRVI